MIRKFVFLILFIATFTFILAGENPTKSEVWSESVELGKKWGVPPEIIFSIAAVESNFTQFNKDGAPFIYRGGSIGIMQIIPKWMDFSIDNERLKKDWKYNMEIGVRVLLDKWNMQYRKLGKNPRANMYIPKIGDGNKMALESWYFALWAYNGWSKVNNPNVRRNKAKDNITYQEKVYAAAKKELGITIEAINPSMIEDKGLPAPGRVFKYPGDVDYSVLVDKGYFDINGRSVLKSDPQKFLTKQIEKYTEKID